MQEDLAEVWIELDDTDLNTLLGDSLYTDHYFQATFSYVSSSYSKVMEGVGFRVRGNTSRNANKKSFKVSFNEYESGRKFKGLEKMNLVGQHNDPSLMRYWLSMKTLRDNGLIASRASFVKLYINEDYMGLYLNVEHIDDEFLQKRFGEDDEGNLYKCLWGSDMNYWGADPSNYYYNYELKTNKSEKDYSGLIDFLYGLNTIAEDEFPCFIEENFEVDIYLKTLAVEMLIGHWDGHAFNKNNFYLYQQPSNGKFVFIEYDMDNTFGVDWVGIGWSTYDLNSWYSEDKPLVERILSYPYYKEQFNLYLEEIITYYEQSDWYTVLQQNQTQLSAAVESDSYYTLDYGFQHGDFLNALDNAFGEHVTQGIAEYLDARTSSGWSQLEFASTDLIEPCLGEEEEKEEEEEEEEELSSRQLVKIVDVLGRETELRSNTVLIYIYDDGSAERLVRLEE